MHKLKTLQSDYGLQMAQAVGKEAFAVVPGEIGGGNGLEAVNVAAAMDLPVVDADFMGRAFPELQVLKPCIWPSPASAPLPLHRNFCPGWTIWHMQHC